jgi:hypothetical protein
VKFSYLHGEGIIMIDPAEANETYRAASAIAAFDAIQVAFAALVKKGILSKAEAEQILREAIETTGAGDQTAELLAIALEKISKFEPAQSDGSSHLQP